MKELYIRVCIALPIISAAFGILSMVAFACGLIDSNPSTGAI